MRINPFILFGVLLFAGISCKSTSEKTTGETTVSNNNDPLPSWNEGPTKKSIIEYVSAATKENSADFIPIPDRIATFDNDGTLWTEQPFYFQLFYALDQVKAMARKHPDWKSKEPYKSVLNNDMGGLMKQGEKGLLQIVASSHAGMTTDEFDNTVREWADTARHPIKKKLYKELVFQPMLELIKFLQANHFKTFIVSGGGIDFMRAWAEDVYGIPRDQIIGSSIKAKFNFNDGKPTITKLPDLNFNDDKEGKPVAIANYIGRKPVFAAGNSDGDLQMLQWTASNKYKNLEVYIHHTDSTREWAYDRKSHIGKFDKGLDYALANKWVLTDMKKDWKRVYPFEK